MECVLQKVEVKGTVEYCFMHFKNELIDVYFSYNYKSSKFYFVKFLNNDPVSELNGVHPPIKMYTHSRNTSPPNLWD